MKKIFFFSLFFFLIKIFAQNHLNSRISSVKVYQNQAEISRKAKLNLSKSGKTEVILSGISTSIDPSSLEVKSTNSKVTLLSAKYENNYLKEQTKNDKIKTLESDLDKAKDGVSIVYSKMNALNGMLDILKKNIDLTESEEGFSTEQVNGLMTNYQTQFVSINEKILKEKKAATEVNEKIRSLEKQLKEYRNKDRKLSGNIVLLLESPSPQNLEVSFSYIVRNAGWSPIYDIRSKGIENDLDLAYKGEVYQNTGVDWENIPLSLSTGNPSLGNQIPELNTIYTQFNYPIPVPYSNNDGLDDELLEEVAIEYKSVAMPLPSFKSSVQTNQLNVDFKLAGTYTILSDNKKNTVSLKKYDMKADYVYQTVPKLDQTAFLIGELTQWDNPSLLPAEANLFFEGGYVGKTYFDTSQIGDTLSLSLGRDESIVVDRKKLKDFSEKKFIGSNKKETLSFEISIRNTKSKEVNIEVFDQIPISTNKQIEVEAIEIGDANYNKETGILKWKRMIAPKSTEKIKLIYSVKSPKKETVYGKE